MNKTIKLLKNEFESSCYKTKQFSDFCRIFKSEFKKAFEPHTNRILINKGHFCISGFLELKDNRIYYFSLGDLRWNRNNNGICELIIRTAKDFKDYTGGSNTIIPMDEDIFIRLIKHMKIE